MQMQLKPTTEEILKRSFDADHCYRFLTEDEENTIITTFCSDYPVDGCYENYNFPGHWTRQVVEPSYGFRVFIKKTHHEEQVFKELEYIHAIEKAHGVEQLTQIKIIGERKMGGVYVVTSPFWKSSSLLVSYILKCFRDCQDDSMWYEDVLYRDDAAKFFNYLAMNGKLLECEQGAKDRSGMSTPLGHGMGGFVCSLTAATRPGWSGALEKYSTRVQNLRKMYEVWRKENNNNEMPELQQNPV